MQANAALDIQETEILSTPQPASALAASQGLLALIRIARCNFCVPHQKLALFVKSLDSRWERYAVLATEIPAELDGNGERKWVIAPQGKNVADSMRNFLYKMIFSLSAIEQERRKALGVRLQLPERSEYDHEFFFKRFQLLLKF